eukprot:3023849-Prymnesium_polylepis.1
MQRVSRGGRQWADRAQSSRQRSGINAQRAVGGGIAPLRAEPRAELEDVVVGRRDVAVPAILTLEGEIYSSSACSDHRGANFSAQAGG